MGMALQSLDAPCTRIGLLHPWHEAHRYQDKFHTSMDHHRLAWMCTPRPPPS